MQKHKDIDIYAKLLSLAKCFSGFGMIELKQLLAISSKAIWEIGDDIFLEGAQGKDMFIICTGKVSIWRKNGEEKLALASLSEGESFGEMGLIRGGVRSAGASALEKTIALRVISDRLHEAPTAAAILYRNIARALAERLVIANDIIVFQSKAGAESPELLTIGWRHQRK